MFIENVSHYFAWRRDEFGFYETYFYEPWLDLPAQVSGCLEADAVRQWGWPGADQGEKITSIESLGKWSFLAVSPFTSKLANLVAWLAAWVVWLEEEEVEEEENKVVLRPSHEGQPH